MKKALKTQDITNELAGASAYFIRRTPPPETRLAKADVATREPKTAQTQEPTATPKQTADSRPTETPFTALPELPTSKQTSMKASTLASYPDSIIETIRKAVKHTGREVT